MTNFETFTAAYIECLEWTAISLDEDGDFIDSADVEDLTAEQQREIHEDCQAFFKANYFDIQTNFRLAGHDFCLTRNGHGAGFWDGNWPPVVETRLTENSRPYGSQTLAYYDEDQAVLIN